MTNQVRNYSGYDSSLVVERNQELVGSVDVLIVISKIQSGMVLPCWLL